MGKLKAQYPSWREVNSGKSTHHASRREATLKHHVSGLAKRSLSEESPFQARQIYALNALLRADFSAQASSPRRSSSCNAPQRRPCQRPARPS